MRGEGPSRPGSRWRVRDADRGAGDAPCGGNLGVSQFEVADQQPARQAGAEAQREGAVAPPRSKCIYEREPPTVAPALLPPEQQAQEQGVQQQHVLPAAITRTRPASSCSIPGCAPPRLAASPACSRSPDSNASRASVSSHRASIGAEQTDHRNQPGSPCPAGPGGRQEARASASASASSAAADRPPSPSNAARRVSGGVSSPGRPAASSIGSRSRRTVVVASSSSRASSNLPRSPSRPGSTRQLPVLGRLDGGGIGMPSAD